MPLLPEYEEPLRLPPPPARERVMKILAATGVAAGAAALFLVLASSSTSPPVPDVPIPELTFNPGASQKNLFTVSVLTTAKGAKIDYIDVEKLAAEEKSRKGIQRIAVESGTHTLVRVPLSFGDRKPMDIARMVNHVDWMAESFVIYRYEGNEPPFGKFFYSRPLALKIGAGRNPPVRVHAGDLLYLYVYSGEVLSLYL